MILAPLEMHRRQRLLCA